MSNLLKLKDKDKKKLYTCSDPTDIGCCKKMKHPCYLNITYYDKDKTKVKTSEAYCNNCMAKMTKLSYLT